MISNTSEGQWCPGAEGDKPDNSSSCAENPQTSTRFPSTGYAATCKPETASAGAPAPVAWMRRWAFDKINVMRLPKHERPRGWGFHAVSEDKLFPDDVPLYALPPSPERGR